MAAPVAAGETVGILFGRERIGLENHEVALADRIVTLPVNPAFASLNLAQAVVIVAYEWFKLATSGALPFSMPEQSPPASQAAACRRSSPRSSASWRRSSSSARPTSATPCRSTCATSSRACSRPSRTSARCTASSRRSSEGRKGPARGGLAQRRRGGAASRSAGRARPGPGAERARPGARAGAAAAPQSDRGRAHVLGRDHEGPALRRARLQAAGAGRARTSPTSCRSR